jgi:hypothetical protein
VSQTSPNPGDQTHSEYGAGNEDADSPDFKVPKREKISQRRSFASPENDGTEDYGIDERVVREYHLLAA